MASFATPRRSCTAPSPPGLWVLLLSWFALLALGCERNYYQTYYAAPDGPDGGEPDGAAGVPPEAPQPDTPVEKHSVDLFGVNGNRYWFAVTPEQVELMNDGGEFGGPRFDDIYRPGGSNAVTRAEHLIVTSGQKKKTANYGVVQLRLLGQSTYRPWTDSTIPNLRVDMDEFTPKHRVGGIEHFRFNNGLVGNIYREASTLAVFRSLGYPAARTSYSFVGGSVWGGDTWVPYTTVEVYKKAFCKRYEEAWGGGCQNIWEFAGDLGYGNTEQADSCQIKSCDNGRMREFESAITSTPVGPGYKEALAEFLDWDAYHRFHCLSWILNLSDGPIHAENNLVIVERDDGLFQYLPYSVDISAGGEWSSDVPLYGMNALSNGCQADPECWADTLAVCQATVADFAALNPALIVDDLHTILEEQGMLRPGDEGRHRQLRDWYERRVEDLPALLEQYRDLPQTCGDFFEWCNGVCVPFGECWGGCEPLFEGAPMAGGDGEADIALPVPVPNPCPIPAEPYAL